MLNSSGTALNFAGRGDFAQRVRIPALLKKECPHLYENYKKLISSDEKNALRIRNAKAISEKPTVYLETDIYKTSRKISELQKVNSNILVKWYAHVLADEQNTVEKLEK